LKRASGDDWDAHNRAFAPVRGRGLKPNKIVYVGHPYEVRPRTGARIETRPQD